MCKCFSVSQTCLRSPLDPNTHSARSCVSFPQPPFSLHRSFLSPNFLQTHLCYCLLIKTTSRLFSLFLGIYFHLTYIDSCIIYSSIFLTSISTVSSKGFLPLQFTVTPLKKKEIQIKKLFLPSCLLKRSKKSPGRAQMMQAATVTE